MSKKEVEVNIADLTFSIFVRTELDQDHALMMSLQMQEGVVFEAIKCTIHLDVIDGRHRIAAHELNGKTTILAEIVEVQSESDHIAKAWMCNARGAKPPTLGDTQHTIAMLLERSESMVNIARLLGLPTGMTRRFAQDIKSRMLRAKLVRAAASVTDEGLTVAKAAEKEGVDLDKLKEMLSGKRRDQKWGVEEVRRDLTKSHQSSAQKNANLFRKLLDKYGDGDVTQKQVREIFTQIESLQKRGNRSVGDWKKRFDAVAANRKSSAA